MISIRAFKQPYRHSGISIFVDDESENHLYTARPIVFEEITELFKGDSGPMLTLPQEKAQILMDDLWEAGIRPSEGSGSAGAFAAQGKHLEDMRQLVFKEKSE